MIISVEKVEQVRCYHCALAYTFNPNPLYETEKGVHGMSDLLRGRGPK